jgi:saccharopine dehydrogenase (NAD+, L-lysine-forming)
VDYERIADDDNRRLIFFSLHAGYAGMIETLWCLGQRWQVLGRPNPFTELRHAYEYEGLSAAKDHLHQLGERIAQQGFAGWDRPLVFGIAGYGNVARGCHEILNCLPVIEIPVEDLPAVSERPSAGATPLLKVVFKEEDMVEPVMVGAKFDLQDYYRHPQKYRGTFARHLPYLDVLVNTIYWDERYPRLVTRDWTRDHYGTGLTPRLQVIGDISCDIEGSIELTLKPTEPDSPCYVYDPRHDAVSDGCAGDGPVIMAVDNLPCELPREASEHFSAALLNLAPQLAAADWGAAYEQLDLPLHLKKALIVHQGELTAPYQYLRQHLGT